MMPGGDKQAYQVMETILNTIAAQVNGEPCVTYMGPRSAGHFVKMVHNGIDYALVQLIAETYELMRKGLGLDNEAMHTVFSGWNAGRLQSFLLEVTSQVFAYKEPGSASLLLDGIKDEAKSKGTGKWTSQVAMDLVTPIPAIDSAVAMRDLSKYKALRVKTAAFYGNQQRRSPPTRPAPPGPTIPKTTSGRRGADFRVRLRCLRPCRSNC